MEWTSKIRKKDKKINTIRLDWRVRSIWNAAAFRTNATQEARLGCLFCVYLSAGRCRLPEGILSSVVVVARGGVFWVSWKSCLNWIEAIDIYFLLIYICHIHTHFYFRPVFLFLHTIYIHVLVFRRSDSPANERASFVYIYCIQIRMYLTLVYYNTALIKISCINYF